MQMQFDYKCLNWTYRFFCAWTHSFISFHFILFCSFSSFLCIHSAAPHNEISRYSSEMSGNESNEATNMTESERHAEINRQKEEMKIKRRKKKRTSSSMQSSTFRGKPIRTVQSCCLKFCWKFKKAKILRQFYPLCVA